MSPLTLIDLNSNRFFFYFFVGKAKCKAKGSFLIFNINSQIQFMESKLNRCWQAIRHCHNQIIKSQHHATNHYSRLRFLFFIYGLFFLLISQISRNRSSGGRERRAASKYIKLALFDWVTLTLTLFCYLLKAVKQRVGPAEQKRQLYWERKWAVEVSDWLKIQRTLSLSHTSLKKTNTHIQRERSIMPSVLC